MVFSILNELSHTDSNLCFNFAELLLKKEQIYSPVDVVGIDHLKKKLALALMDHSGKLRSIYKPS